MANEYIYYEKDGTYFRKRAEHKNLHAVQQVRRGNKWVPFDGDAQAPVFFGSRVSEEEATEGMTDEAKQPDATE
jgi:hypothetical protein